MSVTYKQATKAKEDLIKYLEDGCVCVQCEDLSDDGYGAALAYLALKNWDL